MIRLLLLCNIFALHSVYGNDSTVAQANNQWESIQPILSNYDLNRTCCSDDQSSISAEPDYEYPYKHLKVVVVSDTHKVNQQFQLLMDEPEYNKGDVFIHAGDFTSLGTSDEIVKFNTFLGKLKFRHKLVVAGHRELGFDPVEDLSLRAGDRTGRGTKNGFKYLTNARYLHDEAVVIDGVKFFGTPYHFQSGYPFYLDRNNKRELRAWNSIPRDVDVLITHSPPLGILDFDGKDHWGSHTLLWKDFQFKPHNYTTFINAALEKPYSNSYYHGTDRKPFVFYVRSKN
ncbi:unnamed protein product [Caenorhabditis auriculariae]|uniref:Calcineurin-like phosphoesterase domain-containing protein n=1 Tax=Caenorhabditis auriculariae TaxID=2777116 RepID=A0A8S1H0Z7_9PELO|nr:unnamed protein product [Caenorhabditis auriculariae]